MTDFTASSVAASRHQPINSGINRIVNDMQRVHSFFTSHMYIIILTLHIFSFVTIDHGNYPDYHIALPRGRFKHTICDFTKSVALKGDFNEGNVISSDFNA